MDKYITGTCKPSRHSFDTIDELREANLLLAQRNGLETRHKMTPIEERHTDNLVIVAFSLHGNRNTSNCIAIYLFRIKRYNTIIV